MRWLFFFLLLFAFAFARVNVVVAPVIPEMPKVSNDDVLYQLEMMWQKSQAYDEQLQILEEMWQRSTTIEQTAIDNLHISRQSYEQSLSAFRRSADEYISALQSGSSGVLSKASALQSATRQLLLDTLQTQLVISEVYPSVSPIVPYSLRAVNETKAFNVLLNRALSGLELLAKLGISLVQSFFLDFSHVNLVEESHLALMRRLYWYIKQITGTLDVPYFNFSVPLPQLSFPSVENPYQLCYGGFLVAGCNDCFSSYVDCLYRSDGMITYLYWIISRNWGCPPSISQSDCIFDQHYTFTDIYGNVSYGKPALSCLQEGIARWQAQVYACMLFSFSPVWNNGINLDFLAKKYTEYGSPYYCGFGGYTVCMNKSVTCKVSFNVGKPKMTTCGITLGLFCGGSFNVDYIQISTDDSVECFDLPSPRTPGATISIGGEVKYTLPPDLSQDEQENLKRQIQIVQSWNDAVDNTQTAVQTLPYVDNLPYVDTDTALDPNLELRERIERIRRAISDPDTLLISPELQTQLLPSPYVFPDIDITVDETEFIPYVNYLLSQEVQPVITLTDAITEELKRQCEEAQAKFDDLLKDLDSLFMGVFKGLAVAFGFFSALLVSYSVFLLWQSIPLRRL
ncbi:hypothetical protein [Hydrogenobacter hydrogenophilus]|uniref:Uncharacterized protein n=1 Tax=Hydrogenobacter hydrogenophilus TaxID=35835 RepID=A0A285P4U0_9AQUI|nr:hypothetical protein [Hydrogenobacter hydrogenophilus]SNZ16735.1 hypothetical protein SAMN06265353_1692 [Hydrogenobacter hydrogenophilus]